ncbi:VIN3-like protein 1, partial [Cucurbita argyrosperma subsp. sororia]
MHEIVKDAKVKLEAEVGPLNGISAKMARGIVSRLSVAGDVQTLCSLAIENADKWLATAPHVNPNYREDSLPAACKFLFEEIASSSVVMILVELSNASSNSVKGYKLWYGKNREELHMKDPICVFPRSQRRIMISNLKPCTEYTFRIISYTDNGDLGHSEARCFTKSVEIISKNSKLAASSNCKREHAHIEGSSCSKMGPDNTKVFGSPSQFKVRDLEKILHLPCDQDQGYNEGFCCADAEKCCGGVGKVVKPETPEEQLPPVSRDLDLNVVSVPDLNEEVTPPFESSRDEDDECTLQQVVEADDDAASHDKEKNGLVRSHGSGDSQTWTGGRRGDASAVDSGVALCRKRGSSLNEEIHDCDSTLINGSPFRNSIGSCCLDENFEYCVKIIRWLECEGYIKQEFRLKLLTCLAGQLVDSFSDIISCKRLRS